MSETDLEREDFNQIVTFMARRELLKVGRLEEARKALKEMFEAKHNYPGVHGVDNDDSDDQ